MSQREILKQHGPIDTWKMTDFYTWEEFKQLPKDIQVEWLKYLTDRYHVGLSGIAKIVFERSHAVFYRYLKEKDIYGSVRRGKRGPSKKEDLEDLKKAVAEFRNEVYPKIPEPEQTELVSEVVETRTESMVFSTDYISTGVTVDVVPAIAHMFEGKLVRIHFSVELL